jgi:hypothetical protein
MTKKIVPAPPPLTEEDLQRLREEPWTDEEYHELIKLFQIFPPRIKKTSFEINEGEVVGDRWDAIVYQHNTPPPTEEEKAEYEAREEEKVKWQHRVKRKVGLEHEDVPEVFPHQKRNRSKEQVWDLIDEGVFYNLLKEEAVELTEQQKLEMRTDVREERCRVQRHSTLGAKSSPPPSTHQPRSIELPTITTTTTTTPLPALVQALLAPQGQATLAGGAPPQLAGRSCAPLRRDRTQRVRQSSSTDPTYLRPHASGQGNRARQVLRHWVRLGKGVPCGGHAPPLRAVLRY